MLWGPVFYLKSDGKGGQAETHPQTSLAAVLTLSLSQQDVAIPAFPAAGINVHANKWKRTPCEEDPGGGPEK